MSNQSRFEAIAGALQHQRNASLDALANAAGDAAELQEQLAAARSPGTILPLLVECVRSGQVSPEQVMAHLREEPQLAALLRHD